MARDRRADDSVAILDRCARRSEHVFTNHQHAITEHGAAELPEHHQLYREFGERRVTAQVHALKRRTLQTLAQADASHI